jgi:glyceraldehyde 3-phosphate dehydrogenase
MVSLSPVTRLKTPLNYPGVQPGPIMWSSPPVYLPPAEGAGKHLEAGAKRVVISAPTKDPDKIRTIVLGVNDNE